jgi:hypothetical protein
MIRVQIFCTLDKMRQRIQFSPWQRMVDRAHSSCLHCLPLPGINRYLSTLKPPRSASSFSEDGQSADGGGLEPMANFLHVPDQSSTSATEGALRLMPLGGLVTRGIGSSDGAGYRKSLLQMLRLYGINAPLVGSR